MKYIVELKYTNPAHEHVSLRRRVDTVNRIVEASSEEEAINRAANQQRALGFMIKEAKIITIELSESTPVIDESKKEEMSDEGTEENDDMEDEEDDDEEEDEEEDDSEEKTMKEGIAADMMAMKREKAQKKIADMLLKRDMEAAKKERADKRQAGTMKPMKESVEYIEEKLTASDPASKWISDFVASDNPKFAGKSKKERIQMALGAHYAAKRASKNEEVELVDEADTRVVNKELKKEKEAKATETIMNLAKSKKNKVDAKPTLDVTSYEKKYVTKV